MLLSTLWVSYMILKISTDWSPYYIQRILWSKVLLMDFSHVCDLTHVSQAINYFALGQAIFLSRDGRNHGTDIINFASSS